jgi:superfamily II DNA or RNA helicase
MLVNSRLVLKYDELSKIEWKVLMKKLTFVDADQQVYQCWNYNPERETVTLPRGAWNMLPEHVEYIDRRVCLTYPEIEFAHDLDAQLADGRKYERQKEAVESMLLNEQGIILRPPGTGKSQIALAFASVCRTNVLVLVHTEDILQQWIEYANAALPGTKIGVFRGQTKDKRQITIATVQTLKRMLENDPSLKSGFGCVIADETHHGAAKTWEFILSRMEAKYRFGFTASPTRADGKHPMIRILIGPVLQRMKFQSPVDVKVKPIKTGFYYPYRGRWDWGNLLSALIRDEDRNDAIAEAADREVENGNSVLVLSRRIEHLQRIAAKMKSFPTDGALLVGGWDDENGTRQTLKKETRKKIMHQFRSGEIKCVLGTQLADEALDVPRLSVVILTHPGKHEGRIIQQIGRALREHPDKNSATIYDVADDRVSVLRRQWMLRKQTYKTLKIPVVKRKAVA